MNEIKQLTNMVEQLKKEVWYIAKVSVPEIMKALGSLTMPNLDDIKADIKSNTDNITNLQESVSQQGSALSLIQGKIEDQDAKIASCQSQANFNQTTINTCLTNINAVDDRVMACETDISTCKTGIASVSTTLSQHSTKLETQEGRLTECEGNLQTLTSQLNAVSNSLTSTVGLVSDLSASMEGLTNTVAGHITAINGHENQINSLSSRVSALETQFAQHQQNYSTWKTSVENAITALQDSSGGQGGGVQLDLIYDNTSADASINRGFTSGIVGGKSFEFDFSQYKKVHVYAGLNRCDAYTVIHLDKRRYAEGCLTAVSVGTNRIMNMKVNITPAKDAFVVNQLGWFEANLSTGAISSTRDKGNTSYFVYRIEGEK